MTYISSTPISHKFPLITWNVCAIQIEIICSKHACLRAYSFGEVRNFSTIETTPIFTTDNGVISSQPQLSHMPPALLHVDFHNLDKHLLPFVATVFAIFFGKQYWSRCSRSCLPATLISSTVSSATSQEELSWFYFCIDGTNIS
jgi:hypothetical protein